MLLLGLGLGLVMQVLVSPGLADDSSLMTWSPGIWLGLAHVAELRRLSATGCHRCRIPAPSITPAFLRYSLALESAALERVVRRHEPAAGYSRGKGLSLVRPSATRAVSRGADTMTRQTTSYDNTDNELRGRGSRAAAAPRHALWERQAPVGDAVATGSSFPSVSNLHSPALRLRSLRQRRSRQSASHLLPSLA